MRVLVCIFVLMFSLCQNHGALSKAEIQKERKTKKNSQKLGKCVALSGCGFIPTIALPSFSHERIKMRKPIHVVSTHAH